MSLRVTLAGLGLGALTAVAILAALVVLVPAPLAGEPGASAAPIPPSATPAPTSIGPTAGPSGSAAPASSETPGPEAAFHVGEPAPVLSVSQLGGGTIDVAGLRGKPVWLEFLATTCGPCKAELPTMADFAARFVANDLVVIVVDVREDESTVASYVQGLTTLLPIGLDTDGSAATAWGALSLPVHFWVDRTGVIRAGATGSLSAADMAAKLQTILPGVTVTP